MFTSSDNNKKLFLGIDGGGSKCKAIVMNENNEILGTGVSGPGNPLHGFEQATNSITESALLALKDAGLAHIELSELIAGVGLAGVNLPVLFEQMQAWQHPFKQMFLATDLLIACLGAHQGSDGAVMISGTGSCGFASIDEQYYMLGAHGFPHGDKGSGAWFGLQAAKQVLLAIDGIVAPTIMTEVLLKKLGCHNDTELVETIAGKAATYYAQLANLVFDAAEQGDKVALEIVAEGAEYINSIALALIAKKPPRISMIGGLTIRLKPWLSKDIQQQLSEPLSPPEVGSVLFARKEAAKIQPVS
ncbi:N-acetylglucosamine kinase [Candidatus Colwellia aromaticivorans]|uniref:N-acetylglucosamine kinase n=1 Tax=Candidatus Colwellia aromaticivorans TaxID=2267621 RepID=UPI000DF3591E|nr:BadF/BadG/BcrA/BcrD ATPase family protein [Candidatus Colwellia aromaticivorans]